MEEFELICIEDMLVLLEIRMQKDPEALSEVGLLLGTGDITVLRAVEALTNTSRGNAYFWKNAYTILIRSFFRPLTYTQRNELISIPSGAITKFYEVILHIPGAIARALYRSKVEPGMLIPLSSNELEEFLSSKTVKQIGAISIQKIKECLDMYKEARRNNS